MRRELTSLLSNETLARLERLRLQTSRRFTNRYRGEHVAGREGSSTEFSDYRDYTPGDDLRFVDWNVYSRLRRPYVKIFQHEEELHLLLIVDVSESMNFEGKWDVARRLAAAFGVMALCGGERVSLHVIGGNDNDGSPIFRGRSRAKMIDLFRATEGIQPGGSVSVAEGVTRILRRHRGRGAAMVFSDFYSFEELRGPFNRLFGSGLTPYAVQIIGPSEVAPDLRDDVRLEDAEEGLTLDVTGGRQVLAIYEECRLALESELRQLSVGRGGMYAQVMAGNAVSEILFSGLQRLGWMR